MKKMLVLGALALICSSMVALPALAFPEEEMVDVSETMMLMKEGGVRSLLHKEEVVDGRHQWTVVFIYQGYRYTVNSGDDYYMFKKRKNGTSDRKSLITYVDVDRDGKLDMALDGGNQVYPAVGTAPKEAESDWKDAYDQVVNDLFAYEMASK